MQNNKETYSPINGDFLSNKNLNRSSKKNEENNFFTKNRKSVSAPDMRVL